MEEVDAVVIIKLLMLTVGMPLHVIERHAITKIVRSLQELRRRKQNLLVLLQSTMMFGHPHPQLLPPTMNLHVNCSYV